MAKPAEVKEQKCPRCGYDLVYGTVEFSETVSTLHTEVRCLGCHEHWRHFYTLQSSENLRGRLTRKQAMEKARTIAIVPHVPFYVVRLGKWGDYDWDVMTKEEIDQRQVPDDDVITCFVYEPDLLK